MEKRIELERRARKAHHITELNLDNCRSTSIVGLTDEYTALESLSLINVGLTTLKGFPKLPNLLKLELSDNRISNGLNYLHTSPKLKYLNLCGNKIKDLEALKPLAEFKQLVVLDLFNNQATQIENYREKIFEMVPSLRYLDGFDFNDVEAPSEADDEENGNNGEDKANSDENEEIEDEEEYWGSSSEVDDSDVSLSEVYNDDLEEDEDEWDEGNDLEKYEDDDEFEASDDEETNEPAATNADKDGDAEESQARGKKRKHEG